MRQGVVKVKADSIAKRAAQRQGHTVKCRLARIHPRWHGAALNREESIASRDSQALARNVRARGVAIEGVEAIEIAAIVVAVHALEVIRRRAARKRDISKTGEQVLHKWESGNELRVLLDRSRCDTPIVQRSNLSVVLFPCDARFRVFEILQRSVYIAFQQKPMRKPARVTDLQRQASRKLPLEARVQNVRVGRLQV